MQNPRTLILFKKYTNNIFFKVTREFQTSEEEAKMRLSFKVKNVVKKTFSLNDSFSP